VRSGLRSLAATFWARVAMVLLGIGTQSCLAWLLGPGGRGAYAVALLFATVLSLIFAVGIDVAGKYFVASKRCSLSEGVTNTVVYALLGSAAGIATGLALMHLPLAFLAKAPREAFVLALALIPLLMLRKALPELLTAVHAFGWFAILSVLGSLLQLALTFAFVWGLGWGVNGAVLAMVFSCLAVALLTLGVLRGSLGQQWVMPRLRELGRMLHYGLRYYVGKLSNLVNFQVGTMILAFLAEKEDIGLFAVAVTLTTRVLLVPESLSAVLVPRVAADKHGRPPLVAQSARVVLVICGGLLLVLCLVSTPVVRVFFSPKFLSAVPLVRILAAGVFVRSACKVFVPYLIGTDHPGIASIAVAAGVGVNLVLILVLMPLLHLPGAALAMTASYLVSSAILAFSFHRISGMGLLETWRFRKSDWAFLGRLRGRLRGQTGA